MKSLNIQSLVRENIRGLQPYSSARDDYQGTASVFLDANENPTPTDYNRYPDPHQVNLKRKIAQIKNVNANRIFLGNGSDEPIDLLIRAFCEPGTDNIIIPEPTYGMYRISAAINNIAIRQANLTPEFDIDLEVIEKVRDKNTKVIFLCSPNNPTGNLLTRNKVETLLETFPGLVVLDEAYIDFTGTKGFLPELTKYKNLIILQTFSKAWGLAGIRLGMCFADPEIIQVLDRIKPPYNINSMTQAVALEHLGLEQQKNDGVANIARQRELLRNELKGLSLVENVYPSDANFILVKMTNAGVIYQYLVRLGIIVRDRSKVILCDDCLRITVGTEQENIQLINALKLI